MYGIFHRKHMGFPGLRFHERGIVYKSKQFCVAVLRKASMAVGTTHVRCQPIRTLVVDDSAAALHSICRFLKLQPNIEIVGTATDGREGLASAHALHPDLIVVDVLMPVMNGIEAAARLRQDLPATRIIMMTAQDTPEVRQACRKSGADGFVGKQDLDEELPALIKHIFTPQSGM